MTDIIKAVEDLLRSQKLEVTSPFSASQSGYQGLEGYCRRKRLLSHYKPEIIENDEELQRIFLKGFFTEYAYKNIIRNSIKSRVYTKVEWKIEHDGITIQVNPDIFIPSLNKVIEIKAIKRLPEFPIDTHRIQVGLQMLACKSRKIAGEIHYIEYEGRKWNMKIFEIPPLSNDEIDRIFKEDIIVKELYEKKELPDIPEGFSHTKYPCRFRDGKCPFFNFCWIEERKNWVEVAINDIDKYYLVRKKIRDLEEAIKRLKDYAKRYETILPKEEGDYRVGDFLLSVIKIPRTIVEQHIREGYIKYMITKTRG